MDIYRYIQSKDVAEHCRSIQRTWNPFEMAVIIGRGNLPPNEKHDAWRELIHEYPDIPTPKSWKHSSHESLHQKLKEVIAYEERLIAKFKAEEAGAVYHYKVWWKQSQKRYYHDGFFSSLDKTIAAIQDQWKPDEIDDITIEKHFIDGDECIQALLSQDWIIHNIRWLGAPWADDPLSGLFEYDAFVDIPEPFKRGDLLWVPESANESDPYIFVVDRIWDDKTKANQREACHNGRADGVLDGWGLFVTDAGVPYGDHIFSSNCFEYYHGELKDGYRLLHYVSLFLKDKIKLPELLTMQVRIAMEYQLERAFDGRILGCVIPNELTV